ncbi:DUF898 domain-containing protein [Entomospira culicis]|uniref:DUF898 domain-containing protein n=1 Tax=Entomospira culicis TaxID=2719989 RepID=A0A968GGC5_9SPIO|nr:DUF898 domain-containing protein [Entomospira culicis]NIZ19832.1 DUF898 domain-containing protein [Entomospira culicis]NIZ70046.1 DUF898 domain-containing protein [Entomospira culicis]WDI37152.1 hypothetical protein PVA46_07475 [Entomospira culicis]WDI38781.1 hypothetical protein PVA47_07485 [Entomospira culicis]
MKGFRFEGSVNALMWTLIRTVLLIVGTAVVASAVSGAVESMFIRSVMAFIVLGVMIFALPTIVNSIAKYLVEHTQVGGQKLKYKGQAIGILSLVLIGWFLFLIVTSLFAGLVMWLYQTDLSPVWVTGIAGAMYMLFMAFFASWFILHVYRWVLNNTQIEE